MFVAFQCRLKNYVGQALDLCLLRDPCMNKIPDPKIKVLKLAKQIFWGFSLANMAFLIDFLSLNIFFFNLKIGGPVLQPTLPMR